MVLSVTRGTEKAEANRWLLGQWITTKDRKYCVTGNQSPVKKFTRH